MAKVIFYGVPAHGHTNPTIPLVTELIKRGEIVIYYSSKEFQKTIESTGAIFKAYRNSDGYNVTTPGRNIGQLYYTVSYVTLSLIDDLLLEANIIAPDYIIHDAVSLWGKNIAHLLQVPGITSITTFAFHSKKVNLIKSFYFLFQVGIHGIIQINKAQGIQQDLHNRYGVKPSKLVESLMNEENLNIVYTSTLFQPNSAWYDQNKYKFIGPSIPESRIDSDLTNYSLLPRPLVYISMGTIWKDRIDIDEIVSALINLQYTIVISGIGLKKYVNHEKIIIKEHINQIEVLKCCDAFITHGGMNSVSEALYFMVPVGVFPFQIEQEEVAKRVQKLKCGIRMRKLNKKVICKTVCSLVQNSFFKENCRKVALTLQEAGGAKMAADLIIEYINKK